MQPKEFINFVNETASAGASSTSGIATIPGIIGKKKSEVGTMFGGTYKNSYRKHLEENGNVTDS